MAARVEEIDACSAKSSIFIIFSQAHCCSQQEQGFPADSHLTGMDFFRVVVFLIEIENVRMFFFTLKSAV